MNQTTLKNLKILYLIFAISSCQISPQAPLKKAKVKSQEELLSVALRSPDQLRKAITEAEKLPLKLPDDLQVKLWAPDTLAPDPIAVNVDTKGNVYYTRTHRQKNSEFDIRGHQNWMTPSISLQSVEDRRAFLKETFSTDKSAQNTFLKDLNADGVHDYKDLAVERDEIWKIEDTDADGYADRSTRVWEGDHEEITDIAGALLVRNKDAFVAAGPDVYRLQDKDKNGSFETKTSISHGYAVHIGFGGHGMSGLTEGPDGKIYWGIGDIGANITALDGKKYEYPNEGVIVRSNPDGSDFEVIASGLRNTHEFVFDKYGNIITSDNDGDHPTERERLMHVVEGLDAGWRANWQYGKYTDPKNNKYKVWMDEKLSVPYWEGQSSHILPPIMNFHNGPTGMQFNPGTAFNSRFKDMFFLVEFVGSRTNSPIWAFSLKPKGASFELDKEEKILSGILPTGIKFNTRGELLVGDWMMGWDTKNYGRMWKLSVKPEQNDLKSIQEETHNLLNEEFENADDSKLEKLMAHVDQRVRQKAQFALAERDINGFKVFQKILENQSVNQLAKIHAIWGLGQIAKKQPRFATPLLACLNETDPELLAQALKTLGELKYPLALDKVSPLSKHSSSRVKFYVAEALGKLGNESSIPVLLEIIKENNNQDLYIRHAAAYSLSKIAKDSDLAALSNSDNEALRTASIIALRRMKSEKLALFLNDKNQNLATDAARGIHDDLSIPGAFPTLISCLNDGQNRNEAFIRRALSAAQRLGDDISLQEVIKYAKSNPTNAALLTEAIAVLGTWAEPSVLDRVDGRFRGAVKRDVNTVKNTVKPYVDEFLKSDNLSVLTATTNLISYLQFTEYAKQLVGIYSNTTDSKLKVTILETLSVLKYDGFKNLIEEGLKSETAAIKTSSISLLPSLDVDPAAMREISKPITEKGSLGDKQKLIRSLSQMPFQTSKETLLELAEQRKAGSLDKELWLELSEAIEKTGDEVLKTLIAVKSTVENWMDAFLETLFGGNRNEGRRVFNNHAAAQCTRCHNVGDTEGSNVGPNLKGVGKRLSREKILESLIQPSNIIVPGYGSVSVVLTDGQEVTGLLSKETDEELFIQGSDAEPTKVVKTRIKTRENFPSSMPAMGDLMTKREIRDLIEYLSVQ